MKKNSDKKIKTRKVYNPIWNLVFSLLFSFIVGSMLGAFNYLKLGRKKKSIICFLASIIIFIAAVLTYNYLSRDYFTFLCLSLNIIVGFYLNADQKKDYKKFIEGGGKKAFILLPLIIAIVVLTVLAVFFIFYSVSNPMDKMTYYDDTLYYTSGVSKDDANKFRDFLVDDDVFAEDNSKIAVKLDKSGSIYFISMIVDEKDIDDTEINSAMVSLAQAASQDVFNGAEVDVLLCDSSFKVEKQITP